MKCTFRHLTSGFQLLSALCCVVAISCATTAPALTEANPYSAIIGRNAFALKPPAPAVAAVVATPTPPPNVSLQGISTILGRAQALLKVKIAPKPPDAAKELSLVMDVGQREGDVEVLSIDPATGTVSLSNQGTPLTLNIKDADKPAAGPAIAAIQPIANNPIPGLSPSLPPPAQTVPGVTDTVVKPTVPTRPLRGDNSTTTGVGQSSGSAGQVSMDKVAANVLLYEANRQKNAGKKLPQMPQHTLLQQAPPETK